MLQVFGLHHSHDGSYAQTVIAAQSGAVGTYPVTVDDSLYRVGLKVVLAVLGLLWHHVHVGLQDNSLSVFETRSSGFTHNDVACWILESLYASLLGEVEQESLYFFKMS